MIARGLRLFPVVIAIFSLLLPLTAQQQEKEPPNLLPGRAQWLRARRSDSSGKIPALGRLKALQQARQMRAREQQQFANASFATLNPVQQASLTQWTNIGPRPLVNGGSQYSGRVTALAVDPTNENVVYAGAAEGGIWKTTDGGLNWTPLTDAQSSLSSGSIAIDPNNHNTVYVGTGEEDFFGDEFPGNGILKSTDAGATWSVVSNKFAGQFVGGIAVSPANSQLLMAVVEAVQILAGIWRSTDGGATWNRVTACSSTGTGLSFDPANGNVIYAGCFDGRLFKSTDAGVTWNEITPSGLATTFTGGAVSISVAKSSPSTVYVQWGEQNNVHDFTYKTTDGGATWTKLTNLCSGQCAYNNVIAVDPSNANLVFAGDVTFHRSLNGGSTWDGPSGSTPQLHADNHAFAFSAAGDKLYVADDGGVFSSTTFTDASAGAVTWSDLNGTLAITQFYPGMAIDPNNLGDAAGGTQDNGSNHYTGSLEWNQVFCCDGGFAAMDYSNPNTFYVTCQFECLSKTTDGGRSFLPVENGITGTDGFSFINPLVLDTSNHNILYYAAGQLYQTMNAGANWTQITSPGGTAPVIGTSAVAVAPNNNQMVYLATGGVIIVTSNALSGSGATWTRRNSGLPGILITSIAVDPTNANVAYATIAGFSSSGKQHVFRTTNAGIGWTDISGNLPNAPAEYIVIDPDFPGTLYVGTDVGVFGTSNGGATWNTVQTGLPGVVVMNLSLHELSRTLRAGSYGRSAWDLQLPKPAPACTASSTNPSVTICTPRSGTVTSPVNIVAETTDSHAIQMMQVYIDGKKQFQSATPTLRASLAMAAGTHKLTVQAIDTIGQIFKSTESITVGGSTCTPSTVNPSVTICTPSNGATVSSPVHIVAKTTDSHTVTLMQIYVDGVNKFQVAGSSLDASLAMTAGSHRLTVQAKDSIKQIFKQTIFITVH